MIASQKERTFTLAKEFSYPNSRLEMQWNNGLKASLNMQVETQLTLLCDQWQQAFGQEMVEFIYNFITWEAGSEGSPAGVDPGLKVILVSFSTPSPLP